jgi:hypothetical protein
MMSDRDCETHRDFLLESPRTWEYVDVSECGAWE